MKTYTLTYEVTTIKTVTFVGSDDEDTAFEEACNKYAGYTKDSDGNTIVDESQMLYYNGELVGQW